MGSEIRSGGERENERMQRVSKAKDHRCGTELRTDDRSERVGRLGESGRAERPQVEVERHRRRGSERWSVVDANSNADGNDGSHDGDESDVSEDGNALKGLDRGEEAGDDGGDDDEDDGAGAVV